MKKIVMFFDDYSGTQAEEQEVFRMEFEADNIPGASLSFVGSLKELFDAVQLNDYICVDFGGFSFGGASGFAGAVTARIESLSRDFPSKAFVVLCTMPERFYKDYFYALDDEPNIYFIERQGDDLFRRILALGASS
jgi:hypothetical protein